MQFETYRSYGKFFLNPPATFHPESDRPPLKLTYPVFVLFEEDSETDEMEREYGALRNKIFSLYSSDNFLATTLQQLSKG